MTQWPVRGFVFASDVSTSNWMLWRGPERQVPSEGLIITLKKGLGEIIRCLACSVDETWPRGF